MQSITETVPGGLGTTNIAYSYGPLHRLTDAVYVGAITATFAYDYDPVGNMTAFTETVEAQTNSVSRNYDAANRLEYAVDASGTTTYTYDANGNLIELLTPGATGTTPVGGVRYAYDQRNLMVGQEANPDGTAWVLQAEYVYDGGNDRLQQVDYTGATAITTTYTNDIFGLTQVLVAGDGTTQIHNLFGLDLISQDSGTEVWTLLVDGLGSVRLEMVDDVVETATTYTPYGEVLEKAGASGTVYGFTGEQEDGATGLLYLRARYYNSALKVFQNRDPWEGTGWRPGTLNYYAYGLNNPVNAVDPTGRCGGNPNNANPFDAGGNLYYDCTLDNFQNMPIKLRLTWIIEFMKQSEDGAAENWFNNIRGIIEGFVRFGLAEPGTWLSYVDAGILHAIQDGYALSRNLGGFPRTPSIAWKEFFDSLYRGVAAEEELVGLWGAAETKGTSYGLAYAADNRLAPNAYEQFFLVTGNIYRAQAALDNGLGNAFYDAVRNDWIQSAGTWFPYGIPLCLDVLDEMEADIAYSLGQWFNDPRSTIAGHSPVYWYSIQIWRAQAYHIPVSWLSSPFE